MTWTAAYIGRSVNSHFSIIQTHQADTHSTVSVAVQWEKCALGAMAMWTVTKHHLDATLLPDVLGGK